MALSLTARGTLKAGNTYVSGTRYFFQNDAISLYDAATKIFIPDEPFFSLIKLFCLEGKGLLESYQRAGLTYSPTGNCQLEYLYPNPTLAMPIKFFIYDVTDLVNGQPVSRPYSDGVWVHEQASKILEMYWLGTLSKAGRLELEPGTILPTQEEQACIKNSIKYSNMGITQAFAKCNCSEILPTKYLAQIENLIKTTNDTMFYIYMIAITLATKPPQGGCPEGTKLNPVTMVCDAILDKKNYNLYIGLTIAAIFLLKGD